MIDKMLTLRVDLISRCHDHPNQEQLGFWVTGQSSATSVLWSLLRGRAAEERPREEATWFREVTQDSETQRTPGQKTLAGNLHTSRHVCIEERVRTSLQGCPESLGK